MVRRPRARRALLPWLMVRRTPGLTGGSALLVSGAVSRSSSGGIHRKEAVAALTAMVVGATVLAARVPPASATLGTTLASNVAIKSVATQKVLDVAGGSSG